MTTKGHSSNLFAWIKYVSSNQLVQKWFVIDIDQSHQTLYKSCELFYTGIVLALQLLDEFILHWNQSS